MPYPSKRPQLRMTPTIEGVVSGTATCLLEGEVLEVADAMRALELKEVVEQGDERFGIRGERDAERFGQEFGAKRRTILEEIDEDLDTKSPLLNARSPAWDI